MNKIYVVCENHYTVDSKDNMTMVGCNILGVCDSMEKGIQEVKNNRNELISLYDRVRIEYDNLNGDEHEIRFDNGDMFYTCVIESKRL